MKKKPVNLYSTVKRLHQDGGDVVELTRYDFGQGVHEITLSCEPYLDSSDESSITIMASEAMLANGTDDLDSLIEMLIDLRAEIKAEMPPKKKKGAKKR